MRNLRLRRSQSLPSSINRVSVEMSAPTNPDPSLILGAQDLAPFQLVQTYQYFAADDHALPLIAVRGVLDAHTGLLKRYEVQPGPGEYQLPARLVTYALQQVAVEGTATAWRRVRWPGCTPPARPHQQKPARQLVRRVHRPPVGGGLGGSRRQQADAAVGHDRRASGVDAPVRETADAGAAAGAGGLATGLDRPHQRTSDRSRLPQRPPAAFHSRLGAHRRRPLPVAGTQIHLHRRQPRAAASSPPPH